MSDLIQLRDRVYLLPEHGLYANSYLISGESSCLIDPGRYFEPAGLPTVNQLVATHGHYDHIAGLDNWHAAGSTSFFIPVGDELCLTDSRLNVSDLFGLAKTFSIDHQTYSDHDQLPVDDDLFLEVISTPGHTRGSSCLLLKSSRQNQPLALFTGDTLFASGIGRTDLPTGSSQEMVDSLTKLRKILKDLPADLPCCPGHGQPVALADLLTYNFYLSQDLNLL